jgi:hypothetical protein
MLYQLSYSPVHDHCVREAGLEPALAESQPAVPGHLHHSLSRHRDGTARTCDPSLPKRVLFRLSYISIMLAAAKAAAPV